MENRSEAYLYKLAKGETLQKLSQTLKVPKTAITNANIGLKITCGVTIVIPPFEGETYCVQPWDSVESICEKFGISTLQFQEKNGESYVYAGMIVEI